jgi:SAM-dependent MidA family methyltransferase
MADALRAAADVAAPFRAAARVHLVETSPALRAAQARLVPDAAWHDDLSTLPAGPAAAGRQRVPRRPARPPLRPPRRRWMERHVEAGAFVELPGRGRALPARRGAGGRGEGGVRGRARLDRRLAARVATGGAALLVDYGYATPAFGETLQAMAGHETGLDPLAEPGSRDSPRMSTSRPMPRPRAAPAPAPSARCPQGLLLQRLGLMTRAAMLARARPRLAGDILSGAERLVAAEGMGRLFKALALCDHRLGTPPGFEP